MALNATTEGRSRLPPSASTSWTSCVFEVLPRRLHLRQRQHPEFVEDNQRFSIEPGSDRGRHPDSHRTLRGTGTNDSQGRPANELSDDELEQQGPQAYATRNWVFFPGGAEQFTNHTTRLLALRTSTSASTQFAPGIRGSQQTGAQAPAGTGVRSTGNRSRSPLPVTITPAP